MVSNAQENPLSTKVSNLKEIIHQSKGVEKLKLLDSLSELTRERREFPYDSIVKETITLAFELDSINIAAKHTGQRIFYLVNRIRQTEEGLQLFKNFIAKDLPVTDTLALSYLYGSGADSYFESGFEQESISLYEKAEAFSLIAKDSTQYARYKGYKGFALSQIGEFAKASQEYQKALSIFLNKKDSVNILKVRIGLSILYGQNDFYDEAEKEQQAIDSLSYQMKEYGPYLVNLGNRANNQYAQNNYAAAIKYNKRQLEIIKEFPQFQMFEIAALKTLANSYVETDSLNLAKSMLKRLKEKIDINRPDIILKRQYLEALTKLYLKEEKYEQARVTGLELLKIQEESTYYSGIMGTNRLLFIANEKIGNYTAALDYLKEYITIKDSIESTKKVKALSYYQTLYEMEKRDSEIKQQQSEIELLDTQVELLDTKNKVQFQWMLLIALALFAAGAFYYFNNKKNKQKAVINKNKKDLAEMKNQMLDKEIEYQKKDLTDFAFNISQNQEWAKTLVKKLEKLKTTTGRARANELEDLENEIKNKIWVDDGSYDFQDRIETLSNSFYKGLNSQFPNLTKTEVRLCSLIRMNIENKEIAILQNINPSSVKKSRYRLRKKLNLTQRQDLDEFLQSF
ncbi:hypothetical protein GCM10011344_02460 [Dokdonia pacifica]|nr:hypothetical protein GCM10011344_02460 [Dokdonia pacifica]